jgi:hypothetical protein
LEVFFRTLSVCVFAVRFGVCCARQWRLKRVRFNALCDSMRCGRRSIKSKNGDKKREGDADTERERESCSNVFAVRCGYNGVRRVRLNALRSQIDSKNTDKREREREEGQEQRQGDRVVATRLESLAGAMEF